MPSNLIICPVGDRPRYGTWLAGPGQPDFDLFLLYYGDGPDTAAADARYYVRRKGFKFELLHFVTREHEDVLRRYDRVWCPDDDIACGTESINRMFDIVDRYGLQLAQPAIARGQFSYKALLRQPGKLLRYSPYVEVMCPVFTRDALFRVADTFTENRSGWGLDWIWACRFSPGEVAIIDKVGVHHTGPLGKGEHYRKLSAIGVDPFRDFDHVAARYGGIDWKAHRRMLRGTQRMAFVPDPDDRRSRLQRIRDTIGWLCRRRSGVRRSMRDRLRSLRHRRRQSWTDSASRTNAHDH